MSGPERNHELVEKGETLETFRGDKVTFVRMDGHKAVIVPLGVSPDDPSAQRTVYAGVVGIRDPRLPEDESDE